MDTVVVDGVKIEILFPERGVEELAREIAAAQPKDLLVVPILKGSGGGFHDPGQLPRGDGFFRSRGGSA